MKISLRPGYTNVFPQANDIYKLFILIEFLQINEYDVNNIMKEIKVNSERQVQYYLSAAEYLGLIHSDKKLSEIGKIVFSQDKNFKLQLVCYLILSIDVFADYFMFRDTQRVVSLIQQNYIIKKSTLPRRVKSLIKWIEWCDIVINDFSIEIQWINVD